MANTNTPEGLYVEARPSADGSFTEFGVELEGAWFILAAYPTVKVNERAERAATQAEADAAAESAAAGKSKPTG